MKSYTNIKSLIVTNPTQTASIDTMSLDIAAAMRELGIGARLLMCTGDTLNIDYFMMLLDELSKHDGPSLFVDINGRYDIKTATGNYFDDAGVGKFSFLTDNPCNLLDKLRDAPETYLCGMVSLEHIDQAATYGMDPDKSVFFPHGGPPPLPDQRTTAERHIDILFAGNIRSAPDFPDWLDQRFPGSPALRELLLPIGDTFMSPRSHVYTTLVEAIGSAGFQHTPELLAEIFTPLERYLINRERVRVLQAITGHSVHVIGDVDAEVSSMLPQHRFAGPQTYTAVMDAMARAKISLNIVPTFRNGGHERMFYSLAAGCLLLTDWNAFLEDETVDNAFINFIPDDLGALNGWIEDRLSSPGILDENRVSSASSYAERHTWKQRLIPVLDTLERKYWPVG